jgi:hypothetical protein
MGSSRGSSRSNPKNLAGSVADLGKRGWAHKKAEWRGNATKRVAVGFGNALSTPKFKAVRSIAWKFAFPLPETRIALLEAKVSRLDWPCGDAVDKETGAPLTPQAGLLTCTTSARHCEHENKVARIP